MLLRILRSLVLLFVPVFRLAVFPWRLSGRLRRRLRRLLLLTRCGRRANARIDALLLDRARLSTLYRPILHDLRLRLWSLHVEAQFLCGVYLALSGLGRFVEESYRGEPQTPIVARLRIYQWIAVATLAAGAIITAVGRSAALPPAHLDTASVAAAAGFALLTWFALGVDFPASQKRFARLC